MSEGSHRIARAAEVSAAYERKRRITDQVRGRFARFGDEVCNVVLTFAIQPKAMMRLLHTIGLRSTGDFEEQLDSIWNYLASAGPRDFMKRVHSEKVEAQNATEADQKENEAEATNRSALDKGQSAEKNIIEVQGYRGPDRRLGVKDRRTGRDRRYDVASISKNKRFGRDRRKVRDRRRQH